MVRTYLLVGITGHGKSTTGNVIYNQSGDLNLIIDNPFKTSEDASGCTANFQLHANQNVKIIDTVGFGDPQFSTYSFIINISLFDSLKNIIFLLRTRFYFK
jgi:hypothetical protein